MNEKKAPQKRHLLPIYGPGHVTDGICIGLIFIGMLISAGFFSNTPGSLIVPFCAMLRSWFGIWAIILAFLIVILSITVLVLRWMVPQIRCSKGKQYLYLFLFILILLVGMTLSTLYGGYEIGGSVGIFLVNLVVGNHSVSQVSFILWAVLILAVCLMANGTTWIPSLFRALIQEIRAIPSLKRQPKKPEPEKDDSIAFDWKTEYKAAEEYSKQDTTEEIEEELEKHSKGEEMHRKSQTESASVFSIPSAFSRNKTNQMTKPDQQQTQSAGVKAERSNRLPPLNLLDTELGFYGQNADHQEFINQIEEAMEEFGTPVKVIGCSVGPSVIQYQVVPGNIAKSGKMSAKNIRVTQVAQTERDLAVRLGVSNLSIQAPVPGESYIGIDIPNPQAMKVRLRPLIESPEFRKKNTPLAVTLGRDITGNPVVVDLAQMPHLLVAGTTNSGKSICLRAMAICLAMNNSPEQLRFVMIDPKRVEFYHFNGLPHLLGKVETEYERSIAVLEWAVQEMKNRYQLFETVGARKLEVYNQYAQSHGQKPLPYIVIIIDEMAEIMKGADKQGQVCIDKLTSLARATGMHLIVATQRPDTTVVTGKIKTNIPARIALNVASAVDSRVIMGKQGAEKLLGRGDMYFIDPSLNVPVRVQGALLTDNEIDKVVNLWKKLSPKPTSETNTTPWDEIAENSKQSENNKDEKKLKDALRLVCRTKKASAAYISGKLNVSFPTASRLLNRMEELGAVGPMQLGGKAREVLWDEAEAEDFVASLKNNKKDEEEEFDFYE